MILLICGLLKTELIYRREINPQKIEKQTIDQIVESVLGLEEGTKIKVMVYDGEGSEPF